MRKIRFPKLRAPNVTGRHAGEGRARRTREPAYKGTHRGIPAPPAPEPVKAATVKPGVRKHTPRKLSPLDNRPYETNAPRSPRSRFANADQVGARIDYEKRQRAAQHASQRAGAKKRQPPVMGQPPNPRNRFSEPSSADKNRVAKQLHPGHAKTARGVATRHSTALPGYANVKHTTDPSPETTGRGFAGFYFGARPGKG